MTNDEACGVSASQVWWPKEQEKIYFLQVHGYRESFGNSSFTVREQVDLIMGG
jgi:hypothetical protein